MQWVQLEFVLLLCFFLQETLFLQKTRWRCTVDDWLRASMRLSPLSMFSMLLMSSRKTIEWCVIGSISLFEILFKMWFFLLQFLGDKQNLMLGHCTLRTIMVWLFDVSLCIIKELPTNELTLWFGTIRWWVNVVAENILTIGDKILYNGCVDQTFTVESRSRDTDVRGMTVPLVLRHQFRSF